MHLLADLTSPQLQQRLIEILRDELALARLSHRTVEKQLGLGHGTVGNLLRGRTDLKLHYVEQIGRVLGYSLEHLLLRALGYATPPLPADIPPHRRFARLVANEVIHEVLKVLPPQAPACNCQRRPASKPRALARASTPS